MSGLRAVCVFCGSGAGARPEYAAAAAEMGTAVAEAGLRLVYGGGNVGLMGKAADAAMAAGGEVIGVIPRFLTSRKVEHHGLSELHVVETMHARKAMMAELSDAFAILPGGIGTLEELFEIWTWAQLGLHAKPCGLLNTAGYYDGLNAFLDSVVTEGFMQGTSRATLAVAETPRGLLAALARAAAAGPGGKPRLERA
ncbi:TIGR00730 family Rossman fold protein [Oleispirillum naphthae]|uniref:LOG family protein n=1 Tax=Oleispirillum naphthae TaxID=2838853 RepID=UPI0030822781